MNAHFPNPPPPWSPCRNHSYRVPAGVVLLFKGTMTPGHFRLPCSAPPRPYRALPHWFLVSGRCGPKQWGDPSAQTKQ